VRRTFKLIAALTLLAACLPAGAARAADVPAVEVSADREALSYTGPVTAAGLHRLRTHYAALLQQPRWLAINSSGGEVNTAMDFGDWIFEQRLNVRVVDRCLSACANYLFTAARQKIIEPGAIVAWHGSAIPSPADAGRVLLPDRDRHGSGGTEDGDSEVASSCFGGESAGPAVSAAGPRVSGEDWRDENDFARAGRRESGAEVRAAVHGRRFQVARLVRGADPRTLLLSEGSHVRLNGRSA
jgi:hypothetical protein